MRSRELMAKLGVSAAFGAGMAGAWEFECPLHPGQRAHVTLTEEGQCEAGCTYQTFVNFAQAQNEPVDEMPLPPLDIYPAAVAEELRGMHVATGAPLAYFALGALPVVCVALGSAYQVHVKPKWTERACLWVALMGEPGKGKDPAINRLIEPLREVEKGYIKGHQKDYKDWQEAGDRKKSMPIANEILMQDFTVEALITTLSNNPQGLLAFDGELSSLVNGLGQYKKGGGNDRPQLLKMYTGNMVKKNRAGQMPLAVEYPTLSILGGLQPALFDRLAGEDGFRARFLFADGPRRVSERFFEDDASIADNVAWTQMINRLVSRRHQASPIVIDVSESARKMSDGFLAEIENEKGLGSGDIPAMYRKMAGNLFRIALCVHYMDNAVEGVTEKGISGDVMKRVLPFWTWCQEMAIRVLSNEEPMSPRDLEREKKIGQVRASIQNYETKGVVPTLRRLRLSGPRWFRNAPLPECHEVYAILGYGADGIKRIHED